MVCGWVSGTNLQRLSCLPTSFLSQWLLCHYPAYRFFLFYFLLVCVVLRVLFSFWFFNNYLSCDSIVLVGHGWSLPAISRGWFRTSLFCIIKSQMCVLHDTCHWWVPSLKSQLKRVVCFDIRLHILLTSITCEMVHNSMRSGMEWSLVAEACQWRLAMNCVNSLMQGWRSRWKHWDSFFATHAHLHALFMIMLFVLLFKEVCDEAELTELIDLFRQESWFQQIRRCLGDLVATNVVIRISHPIKSIMQKKSISRFIVVTIPAGIVGFSAGGILLKRFLYHSSALMKYLWSSPRRGLFTRPVVCYMLHIQRNWLISVAYTTPPPTMPAGIWCLPVMKISWWCWRFSTFCHEGPSCYMPRYV